MNRRQLLALAGAVPLSRVSAALAQAPGSEAAVQEAQAHFAGRTVRLLIPAAAGSGTDRSARQFIDALQRLLPGTRLRIENIDRAGGQIAASELWRAPTDGSVVGFLRSNLFYSELMERATLDFGFTGFTFFGSINRGHRVLVLGNESRIENIETILSGDRIVLKSADAVNSSHYYEALLMNALAGSRIMPVPGFAGGSRNMAVISGEVDCQIGSIEAVQPIVDAGAGRIVFRLTSDPLPEGFPEVPRLADHIRDPALAWAVTIIDAAAMLGRPFAGPPGMDPSVAGHWTALFEATVNNPAFREVSRVEDGLVIDPASADEIAALLSGIAEMGEGLQSDIDSLLDCGHHLASNLESQCD